MGGGWIFLFGNGAGVLGIVIVTGMTWTSCNVLGRTVDFFENMMEYADPCLLQRNTLHTTAERTENMAPPITIPIMRDTLLSDASLWAGSSPTDVILCCICKPSRPLGQVQDSQRYPIMGSLKSLWTLP